MKRKEKEKKRKRQWPIRHPTNLVLRILFLSYAHNIHRRKGLSNWLLQIFPIPFGTSDNGPGGLEATSSSPRACPTYDVLVRRNEHDQVGPGTDISGPCGVYDAMFLAKPAGSLLPPKQRCARWLDREKCMGLIQPVADIPFARKCSVSPISISMRQGILRTELTSTPL